MGKNLDFILKAVCDEDSFTSFIAALAADRAAEVEKERLNPSSSDGLGQNGWENGTIEAFLDSASAWAADWKDSPQYQAPDNAWQRCARIMYAGKSYE